MVAPLSRELISSVPQPAGEPPGQVRTTRIKAAFGGQAAPGATVRETRYIMSPAVVTLTSPKRPSIR